MKQTVVAGAFSSLALLRVVAGGAIIGAISVVFVISFAAILFNIDSVAMLSRGIGLALFGAAIMAVAGVFLLSYRGTICQPQDVTAILLAIAAARVVEADAGLDSDALFATVAALSIVATAATGLAAYLFGQFKLSFVARFIPYPVMGGFLAATGYLLVIGAIGMTMRSNVTLWQAATIFAPANLLLWMPWVMAGGIMVVTSRIFTSTVTLPACMIVTCLVFFSALGLSGTSLDQAREAGFLLGPFPESGFLNDLHPGMLAKVDWRRIGDEVPIILAVAAMAIFGSLLNATGFELSSGRSTDLDSDLRGVGLANLLSSFGGGLVGYQLLGEMLLARRMGLTGVAAGLSAALCCLLALALGAQALSLLPIGLFASMIAYLGIDLLYTWLWQERRKIPLRDFAIIAIILIFAATIGFLEALAVGLVAASVLFIFSYSGINFMRPVSTLAMRRSMVERGERDTDFLTKAGERTAIFEMRAYLFFGTASKLLERVKSTIARKTQAIDTVVIDFTQVQGLDTSATHALNRIVELCHGESIRLSFSGMPAETQQMFQRFSGHNSGIAPKIWPKLDDALQSIEFELLARRDDKVEVGKEHFLEELRSYYPNFDISAVFDTLEAGEGDLIVEQGRQSNEIYILIAGQLRADVVDEHGGKRMVARFLPGALIGEIAYYGFTARSATLISEGPSTLMKIEPRRLENSNGLPPSFAADFHRLAACHLAKRLVRLRDLMHNNGY